MQQYLLSTFQVEGEVPGHPSSPEEMQAFMQRVMALEAEMEQVDAFVFGGALLDPGTASVFSPGSDRSAGPFAEANAYLAGFYIINAEDDDAAHTWAEKVAAATNHPIEVRAFRATGRVKDHLGPDS